MSNKDIFKNIQKKTNVSEKAIKNVASKVKPQDLQDEKKLRALISQVGSMAGVPVAKSKEDQIVKYFMSNKASISEMQKVIKMFSQPK
jgi:molybdate-binding protein